MPCRCCRATPDNMYSGTLEASGEEVEEWLRSLNFEAYLFSFFPCTDILPSRANKARCFPCSFALAAYGLCPRLTHLSHTS